MLLEDRTPPLPIGWPLLPVPDDQGRLVYPGLAESVRQSLEIILSTRPGEQLMHPGFGAGLTEFLGESNTVTTRKRIYDRVTESIGRWETRVELDRVDVAELPDQPSQVRVEIAYRLRRTGEARSLGVNLQLES